MLTIGLHAALLMLPTLVPQKHPLDGQVRETTIVFISRTLDAPAKPNGSSAREVAFTQVGTRNFVRARSVVDSPKTLLSQPRNQAAAGAAGPDPFSKPGLAFPARAAAVPVHDRIESAQELIQNLFANMESETPPIACTTLTASFVATVNADGRLTDVHFIVGSLGPDLGDHLARALETKLVFAPSANSTSRRTTIGPIMLDPHREPEHELPTGAEPERCQG